MTTKPCAFCGLPLDTEGFTTLRHVEGWEQPRRQGGANKITLRKVLGDYACAPCISMRQRGIPTGQSALFGTRQEVSDE